MYQFYFPSPALQPFIASYWIFRSPDGQPATLQESVFVDGQADLLFNFGCSYTRRRLDSSGVEEILPASNLDAQRDYPVSIDQHGDIDLIAVRFRPGGLAAFLPIPSHELSNQTLDLSPVFKQAARELEHRLFDASGSRAQQIRLLDTFFLHHLRLRSPYEMTLYLAQCIESAGGSLSIQELAGSVGYSIRTIDRLFRECFGLTPKFYARIARFQVALKRLSKEPTVNLAELALACGYYDHAHLSHEFTAFTGHPPDQYRAVLVSKAAAPPPNLVQFLQAE